MNRDQVTKPSDMKKAHHQLLDEICEKFEAKFKEAYKGQGYYHLVIEGEYDRAICDSVEKVYTEAGWKNVCCATSSEKSEKYGLTGLQVFV